MPERRGRSHAGPRTASNSPMLGEGGAAEGRMLEQPGLARAGRTENMARLDDVAKRMRCLKCGEKKCTLRAFPPQKPRGYRSLPK
jgi:hypothetical protein